MADVTYWKLSTTYRDGFTYNVTGLVDADFTKVLTKNGVDVPAPPGITISNVTGTVYDVVVDPVSGFPAATGVYHLVIYRTATPNDRWESLIAMTTNGLPNGTTGLGSFTSTTGNGRIADGVNPILGAQVYVRRSSGALYAVLTTNSAGNWGPVYFDEDGVFSLSVQASGYTVGTGSVTVAASGTSVTGPGADITLTASSVASAILASSLWAYARRMFHSRNGTKADTEVRESVNDAIRMVAQAKDWNWLYTTGRIDLKGAYTTGTVEVTEGSAVVTLTDGTFPTWAADGEIFIGSQWQPILTRDSATQLTLVNAWADGEDGTGKSYVLAYTQYELPSNLRTMVHITTQANWVWGNAPVSRWQIDVARQSWTSIGAFAGSYLHAIERDRLVVWPYPSQDLMVNLLYVRQPAALTSPTDTADWDANQLEVLERAIDFQIALRGQCVAGSAEECRNRYEDALNRAFPMDRSSRPRRAGWTGGGQMGTIPAIGARVLL